MSVIWTAVDEDTSVLRAVIRAAAAGGSEEGAQTHSWTASTTSSPCIRDGATPCHVTQKILVPCGWPFSGFQAKAYVGEAQARCGAGVDGRFPGWFADKVSPKRRTSRPQTGDCTFLCDTGDPVFRRAGSCTFGSSTRADDGAGRESTYVRASKANQGMVGSRKRLGRGRKEEMVESRFGLGG